MPVKLRTAKDQLLKLVKKGSQTIVEETASDWRDLADQMVPQIENARFATDALRFSATILAPTKSDYAKAIAKALRARQAAIDAGEPWAAPLKVLPEVRPVGESGLSIAVLSYPVGHAVEVHEGLGGTIGARPFLVQTKPGQIFKSRLDLLAVKMSKVSV